MDRAYTDQRVHDLIHSPLGCFFLLDVDAMGLTPEDLADPQTCFGLAYGDLLTLDRNNSSGNPFIVAEVLERGRVLAPLARLIVEHPGTSWWFADLDLNQQLWVAHDDASPDTRSWTPPASPPEEMGTVRSKTAWGPTYVDIVWQRSLYPRFRGYAWRGLHGECASGMLASPGSLSGASL